MLCQNQRCSYNHWISHANRKISSRDNRRYFNTKKSIIISRILNEYKQKPPSPDNFNDETLKYESNQKSKYSSVDSIVVPKDPTSPYAFTLNVNHLPNTRQKKYLFNQVCFDIYCYDSMTDNECLNNDHIQPNNK